MDDNTLLLKAISNKIDDYLYEVHDKYKLKNVEWEVFANLNEKQIEVALEDFGTGGSIHASIEKEDLFCASMIINKDKNHTLHNALAGLITATLLNNLAIAGIKSLTDICSEKDLKFFLNRFKRKEE